MSAVQDNKATLPVPKNLLFIEHDVPSSTAASASTTPTDPSIADPLAAVGAGIPPPAPQTNGATSPPVANLAQRVGKLGLTETKLPDVHAEPHEYYGGAEVWTRARTFSNSGVAGTTKRRPAEMSGEKISRNRRLSHEETMRVVLEQEDTDRNAREKPNLNLTVEILPEKCDDPAFVKSLNDKPGILALAMDRKVDKEGKVKLEALPFIVPGARFNEKYGWDSSIVEHCIFEIKHYNKVLNGNRSYYLARSQPPFLTDLALQIYNQLDRSQKEENKSWLKRVVQASIKEYHSYWMSVPSLDPASGLSRYRPVGLGIPPETEATHFTHILQPYAQKLGISVNEYIDGYNNLTIAEPELDEYFMHDRGYEFDIASAIDVAFDGEMNIEEEFPLSPWPITVEAFAEGAPRESSTATRQTSKHWFERAARRKEIMDELCWNDGYGMYFDYDTKAKKQARYESATTLWPLWAGCASETQALKLVRHALPKLEVAGGLVSGTEESRGIISLDRPNRQWDYPYAWPPHQIMAWVGLERYGFVDDAARLAYRWIYMMTLSFVDFNGIVPEKFDAVELSHMVDAEYGNQGTEFKYVPREGFGWMNSAYQIGLQCLSTGMRRAVANCVPPWVFFNLPAPDFSSAKKRRAEREAREAEAAASGHGGAPKLEVHHDPPSLEEAVAKLKLELGHSQ
ncbi:uncharacterized protein I206_103353 [Kwoniella pini CBS 10737]|uniref:Trehalase n=1 Tax=Kwoniella pini CBS 10737 TaxID=1296096 RepID=A0AAJ8L2K0_9TREE